MPALCLTKEQLATLLDIVKTSMEYSEHDTLDFTSESLMQFYKDRAIIHNTIKWLLRDT